MQLKERKQYEAEAKQRNKSWCDRTKNQHQQTKKQPKNVAIVCIIHCVCAHGVSVFYLFILLPLTSAGRNNNSILWQQERIHSTQLILHQKEANASLAIPRKLFFRSAISFFLLLLFTFIRLLANDDCKMMPKAAVALLRLPQIAWVVMCMAWLKKKYIWPPCGNSKPERI